MISIPSFTPNDFEVLPSGILAPNFSYRLIQPAQFIPRGSIFNIEIVVIEEGPLPYHSPNNTFTRQARVAPYLGENYWGLTQNQLFVPGRLVEGMPNSRWFSVSEMLLYLRLQDTITDRFRYFYEAIYDRPAVEISGEPAVAILGNSMSFLIGGRLMNFMNLFSRECEEERSVELEAPIIPDEDVTKSLIEFVKFGNREDFDWMAQSYGVKKDKLQEMWDGTRRRLNLLVKNE